MQLFIFLVFSLLLRKYSEVDYFLKISKITRHVSVKRVSSVEAAATKYIFSRQIFLRINEFRVIDRTFVTVVYSTLAIKPNALKQVAKSRRRRRRDLKNSTSRVGTFTFRFDFDVRISTFALKTSVIKKNTRV